MTGVLLEAELEDESASRRFAARLSRLARPGDVFALEGELGVGKTAFARAFIQSLKTESEEVPSPTFTLVQTYDTTAGAVFHFDLYRLKTPEEAYELNIEEAFADAISLVEWPDRLGSLLPPGALTVHLIYEGQTRRRARLGGAGGWAARLREAGLA